MKCANCKKTLKDEIVAYCEKCEEIYCMNCCKGHTHGLSFMKYENNKITTIPIGLTGMGFFENHHKFYLESNDILKNSICPHAKDSLKEGKPIFKCEDGKIRCGECFYNSKMKTIQPFLKLNDENKLIWLLPSTFDPFNLNFIFNCDNEGIKGESINANIKIENNKKNAIDNINIFIGALAADPCPTNKPYELYLDDLYPFYLICKNFHFNSIDSNDILNIDFKLDIPRDCEIKISQFVQFYEENGSDNIYCKKGFLNVPENLMIYACFSYKTYSDHRFISNIETDIVKLK